MRATFFAKKAIEGCTESELQIQQGVNHPSPRGDALGS